MALKQPYMVDELETLKSKTGESIECLWSRMKVLRVDLLESGYECTDQSIVQRIYKKLKLHLAWRAAMYHLSEAVLTMKLPKFKIQLHLVEPPLPELVQAHVAQRLHTVQAVVAVAPVVVVTVRETTSGSRRMIMSQRPSATGATGWDTVRETPGSSRLSESCSGLCSCSR